MRRCPNRSLGRARRGSRETQPQNSPTPGIQFVTCAFRLLWHCRDAACRLYAMITLEERIAKTERLLRRLEDDQPYLHVRLSALGAEHRQSASAFADSVRAQAEAELQRLLAERALPYEWSVPEPAD
jgi:hypothetical protein